MDRELTGRDALLGQRVGDEPLGEDRALGGGDHPARDVAGKTSRMTYRENQVHFAGPFNFVMSHDQSSFGAVARSSGRAYAG